MTNGYTLPTQAGPKSGGGGFFMLAWVVVASFIASQVIAARFAFNPELGTAFVRVALLGRLYAPWSVWAWAWKFSGFSGRVYDAPVSLWTPWAHNAIAQGLVIGLVGGLFAMFVLAAMFARMTPQQSVKNLADSSGEWATEADVERTGLFGECGMIQGFFRGAKGLRTIRYGGDSGAAWFAPPGSGKSSSLVTNLVSLLAHPDAWKWSAEQQRAHPWGREPSHIILDVRGYLSKASAGWRRAIGHHVYIFEPFSTEPGRAKINPLWTIDVGGIRYYDHCYQAALDVIGDTDGLATSSTTYWDQACTAFLAAVIGTLGFLSLYRNDPKLFSYFNCVDYICSFDTIEDLLINMEFMPHDPHGVFAAALPDEYDGSQCKWILRCIQAMVAKAADEKSGVFGTLAEKTNIWRSPVIREHIRESTFSIKGLANGDRPGAFYISIPGMKLDHAKPLTRAIISHALRELTEDGSGIQGGREVRGNVRPVIPWLDEIAAMRTVPVLAYSLGFLRGHGVYPVLFFQSVSQLWKWYSKEETLTETLAVHCFQRPNTHKAAKEWSEGLDSFSLPLAKSSTTTNALGVPSISSSVEIHKRSLLTPGEVLRLPKDETIMLTSGLKIRAKTPFYWLDKDIHKRTKIPPVTASDVTVFRAPYLDRLERVHGAAGLALLLSPIPPPPPLPTPIPPPTCAVCADRLSPFGTCFTCV